MRDNARILTTGDVARYCGVSRMGVLRWIRQGKLKAYRTPGGHYRIRIADFRDFLEEYDIPADASFFGEETRRILVVANDASALGTIVKALSAMPEGYEIDLAPDGPSATAKIADFDPALVILDTTVSGIDTPELVQRFEADMERRSLPVLTLMTPAIKQTEEEQPASTAATGHASLRRASLAIEALQCTVRRLLAA